jgi:ankyrin repeat protein
MPERTYYRDTPLATTPNMHDNKTLFDLACWIPGRESQSVYREVRDYAEQLINDGVDVNMVYGEEIETALIAATRRGYHSFMEFLLSHGASPYPRLANGNTALHFCAARGDIEGAEILRYRGVFRSSPNRSGHEPLGVAFLAPEERRLEMVRYLLEAGMPVNLDHRGPSSYDSALHHAIGPTRMNQDTVTTPTSRAIVDLLMHYGADVYGVDLSFKSPLHIVAELRDRKMLYTLLSGAYKYHTGINSPRMPPLDGVGDYTATEYAAYIDCINEPLRTSLLFIVLRCIEMMKRSFTFALGVRRNQTGMQHIPPEMVSRITSYNINHITAQYTRPWNGRAIEEIAMTALGWMHNKPVKPIEYDW